MICGGDNLTLVSYVLLFFFAVGLVSPVLQCSSEHSDETATESLNSNANNKQNEKERDGN